MTVVQPNSISGITSLTCSGDTLSIHDSGGNLIKTLVTGGGDVVTGVLTVSQIGSATDTLTIPGNLTVQGTRTILNTDELNVRDKLVGIGSTASPSSLSQDNSGIIIYGQTNVELKYEVKKAAVGLNTALCVAGVVTAMSGLTVTGDATFNGGAGAVTIPANSDIRIANGTWSGEYAGKIQHNSNKLYLQGGTSGWQFRSSGGTGRWEIDGSGHLYPVTDSSYDLGTNSLRLRNAYVDTYYGDGSQLTGVSAGVQTAAQTGTNAVVTLDLSKQDHKLTLAGICTVDCQNGTEGDAHTIRIVNSGITTVGFSTYFLWPGGAAPFLPTTSGAIHQLSFTVHHVGAAGTQLLSGASLNYS